MQKSFLKIASLAVLGVAFGFSSCEKNDELKNQIEKILANENEKFAKTKELLAKVQQELNAVKLENSDSLQQELTMLEDLLQNDTLANLAEIEQELADLLLEINPTNGHDFVDLGLPSGNLWATCNLGATSPEEMGDLYAWGELEPKEKYTEENYIFYKNPEKAKYFKEKYKNPLLIYPIELELADDVAHMKLGGKWRIPSKEDFEELIDNCSFEYSFYDGNFIGKNGNKIFLKKIFPFKVFFLTRSKYDSYYSIWIFYSGSCSLNVDFDYAGYMIRPVCYKNKSIK